MAEVTPVTKCEAVASEIRKYSEWNASKMLAIAQAENGTCDPLNHNLTMSENHRVCVGSYGVLQVGCLHYEAHEDRDDLSTNVAVAYRVWQQQGYQAWSVFNSGKYRAFL